METRTIVQCFILLIAIFYLANASNQEAKQSQRSRLRNSSKEHRQRADNRDGSVHAHGSRGRHRRLRAGDKPKRQDQASQNQDRNTEQSLPPASIHIKVTQDSSNEEENQIHQSHRGMGFEPSARQPKDKNSGASHDPLFGSEPPVTEQPENPQFRMQSRKKSVPKEQRSYADQPMIYSDNNLASRQNVHSNSLEDLTHESFILDKSEDFSLDYDVISNESDLDIEVTTQGQLDSSVENLQGIENQGGANDETFLKDIVIELREQLKESKSSQRVTRSVLATLEEKQDAQARDLQIIKDEVLKIKREQIQQHTVIMDIKGQVDNSDWALRDVKEINDEIVHDFGALKTLQLAHNDTMIYLADLSENNMAEHEAHASAIKHLQRELLEMRTHQHQHSDVIAHLQRTVMAVTQEEEEDDDGDVEVASAGQLDSYSREIHNNIPVVPSIADYTSSENSGVGSNSQESITFDELASSIEEKHNVIGDHLSRIVEREERLEDELTRMHGRFASYDARLAQLHNFFLNISLQVSNSERDNANKGMTSLHEIASQMMNFTEQLVHMQQWHVSTRAAVNTTWSNQQAVYELQSQLDVQAGQLQELERRADRGRQHRNMADNTWQGFEDRVAHVESTLRQSEGLLTQLQVQVLNSTLAGCEKASTALKQELQIHDLDTGLNKVEKRLDSTQDKISKIERGVSKLFELSEKQGHAVSRLVSRVQETGDILPVLATVQADISNLLSQLPADCNDILLTDPSAQDGVYLIHARHSGTSALLACQFDQAAGAGAPGSAWTVIQHREGGNLSFARTWHEYKYGFGEPGSEFWIGNEQLYYLTSQDNYQLRIDMVDLDNQYHWATYDVFHVSDESNNYQLELSSYHGNATDALRYSNHMSFSTIDKDNDVSSTNCAKFYTAGWWYKHCHYANLNGRFTVGIVWFNHDQDEWVQMKRTTMKIRPLKNQYDIEDNRVKP